MLNILKWGLFWPGRLVMILAIGLLFALCNKRQQKQLSENEKMLEAIARITYPFTILISLVAWSVVISYFIKTRLLR